ncbi:MAG: carph-isopro domain-containing protein [Pseudonocardiaceae bacterium]
MADGPNEVLASLLAELGWSPRALARRINHVFGVGTVADTAAYHWRDSGCVPRPPLPELAAWVLARELGRPVTPAELWQGRASGSPLVLPADIDMNGSWSRAATLGLLDDWVAAGLLDRRHFLAVSGTTMLDITTGYPMGDSGRLAAALERGSVGNPLLDQIEQSIPLLQRLDDTHGGGAYLPYVGAQFRAVALLLRQGGHAAGVERRLFAALAEIGLLAGRMALDAGRHGLAQRYLFTALRAAREAGYHEMAAHVLADLAFQAATREYPRDAIALGQAAVRVATVSPAGVRALMQNRFAYGHALAGRLDDFERAYATSLDILAGRDLAQEPTGMDYLTSNHLDTKAGQALAHAGTLAVAAGDRQTGIALLSRSERLLRNGAHDLPVDHPAQRRALFEGAWLAVAAAGQGDLEQACTIGSLAVTRLNAVQSARSAQVLRLLAKRLRRCSRNEYVRDFSPTLDAAVARQPVPA